MLPKGLETLSQLQSVHIIACPQLESVPQLQIRPYKHVQISNNKLLPQTMPLEWTMKFVTYRENGV